MSLLALMKDPAYVDQELAKLLETGPSPKGLDATTDIYSLRELLLERKKQMTSTHQASGAAEQSQIDEINHQVPTRDGSSIRVRVYKVPGQNQPGPLLVMLHGGGFVLGELENEALLCRQWCSRFGGVSVNVEYRLAPEHVFPVPVHDSYDAFKWAVAHASSIGADASKGLIVAGVSAGANMAATISHLYRDEGGNPPLTGVYLSIPSLLSPEAVPEKYKSQYLSRDQNKDAPILNEGSIRFFRKYYQDDPCSPLMSPFIFPSGHRNLPPTYFQICGMDPLRDEGLLYEQDLRADCGVETRVDLYPGLPHGFWSWWPEAEFSKKQFQDSLAGLEWLLKAR